MICGISEWPRSVSLWKQIVGRPAQPNDTGRVLALAADLLAVELAIWFHDAVYDPQAADNEARSAGLARDWMGKCGAAAALTDAVGQLILATKSHDATLHADAPLLVDVDLSILGQPPDRFWEYERQIRDEYSWVDKGMSAARRAEILQRFLARARIYHTALFFHRLETQARTNRRASVQPLSVRTANGSSGLLGLAKTKQKFAA